MKVQFSFYSDTTSNPIVGAIEQLNPPTVQLEDLDRFAKEVMPAFHPANIAAAAE